MSTRRSTRGHPSGTFGYAPRMGGPVLAAGLGDDLAAVIAGAAPGATLALGPGEHRLAAPVALNGALAIVGEGADETSIVAAGDAVFKLTDGADLTIRDLSLGLACGDEGADVVALEGGRLAATGCRLSGARDIDDRGGVGVRVGGDGRVLLQGCELSGHGFAGVYTHARGAATLERCSVSSSRFALTAFADAPLVVRDSELADGTNVVFVADGARVELHRCSVTGGDHGIGANAGAAVTANDCEIAGAAVSGVLASGGVALHGCRVGPAPGHGILVLGEGVVELAASTLSDARQCGVLVRESGRATLSDVEIVGCGQVGLFVDGAARVEVAGARITGGFQCAQISGGAHVSLRDCRLGGATDAGAVVRGEATLRLATTMSTDNGTTGLAARDTARLTAEGCEVRGNRGCGVGAWESATLEVRRCTVQRNGAEGIAFFGDSRGEALGNGGGDNARADLYTVGDFAPLPDTRPLGATAPEPAPLAPILERLARFLGRRRRGVKLRSGASGEAMAVAEAQRRAPLPAAARELFSWRDGQDGDASVYLGYRLCSLQESVEAVAVIDEVARAGDHPDADDWWHGDWIPILDDDAGNHICVDAAGAFGGYPGQVVEHLHDDESREILAPSLAAFLLVLVECFEAGLYRVQEGFYEPTGDDAVAEIAELAERVCPGYPIAARARYRQRVTLQDNAFSARRR